MSYADYLRSHLSSILICICLIALVCFVLAVTGVSISVYLLISGMIAVAAVLASIVDYLRRRPFYSDLMTSAREIEHPLWIAEMVDRPDFIEGEVAYDALRAISKAANDDVSTCRRQASDYREYIETWVHEAKSPLAAAHLMLENLVDAVPAGEIAERVCDKADALEEELDRVETYIEQALFFARSEALDRDYLIRSHSLKQLVTEAIKANARSMIAAHVAPMRRGLDLEVFTDDKWMVFILGQLIQNSVKYACPDGADIEFSGRMVDAGTAREAIVLTVRDNGCGVPAADLPRVFEKGFTGENGRTGKRSTGIGLYLVSRLCSKMGIGVAADSVEGEGFAVHLRFPNNKMHYFEQE